MTGLLVALLLGAAAAVLRLTTPFPADAWRRPPGGPGLQGSSPARGLRVPRPKDPPVDPNDIPLFVRQLTGLLQAGRMPQQLWADLEAVYAPAATPRSGFAPSALPVIQAAARAAALGLSVPEVLNSAPPLRTDSARASPLTLWVDLAACFSVAERTGAPLAQVLARYADQLDAELDAQGARDSALAGPKATVSLLTWLPVFGLLLGYLIGADPLRVLFGSPLGNAVLAAGCLLMAAARVWCSRLVAAAARRT